MKKRKWGGVKCQTQESVADDDLRQFGYSKDGKFM